MTLLALVLAVSLQSPDDEFRKEVRDGKYAEAEALLANPDVNPDSPDEDGWTALMYASRSDRPELVTLLVKAGANLDAQNEDGETALIVAVRRGRVDSARLLLMAGANVSIQDTKGRTALGWAEDQNRLYLAQIIHIASEPSAAIVTVAERPVMIGDETLVPPKLLKETPPLYTEDAFERGVEGRVVLKVIVRKDGRVGAIRVHESLDKGLDEAAVEAVKTWTFEPAKVDGEPINVFTDIEVDFSLKRSSRGSGEALVPESRRRARPRFASDSEHERSEGREVGGRGRLLKLRESGVELDGALSSGYREARASSRRAKLT